MVLWQHPSRGGNFEIVVLGIIAISRLPVAFELLRGRFSTAKTASVG
jgi:hypothetical protein